MPPLPTNNTSIIPPVANAAVAPNSNPLQQQNNQSIDQQQNSFDPPNKLQDKQQISQKLPFKRVYYKTLQKGSLCSAQYLFWQHDPNPLVLVTDVWGDKIRGVNLHYLTFKYVKSLLDQYCNKQLFGYSLVKHDQYIINAFRTYKKAGLRNLQLLDCDIINNQFKQQRKAYKYNPQELKTIREMLRKQLNDAANPKAEELSNQYANMIGTGSNFKDLASGQTQDGRRAFVPNQAYPATTPTIPTQSATISNRIV